MANNLKNLIFAYGYSSINLPLIINEAIKIINNSFIKKQILLINKNTFSECELNKKYTLDLSRFPKRSLYLKSLNKIVGSSEKFSIIGTTGNTSREMYSLMKNCSNFYMVGNMGGALSLGLGASLGGKKILICGGDAEFVMHLGGMTTTGRYSKKVLLIYLLFDNEMNKSTGGQNSYQKHINYLSLAKSCGWETIKETVSSLSIFEKELKEIINFDKGLFFFHIKCNLDAEYLRPSVIEILDSKESFK